MSNLSVSYPPDPLPVSPGSTSTFTLQVTDTGNNPLPVIVTSNRVVLLDNGETQFAPGPDPRFANRITVTPNQLSLSPHQQLPVTVSVTMPAKIAPDDYYLGFLVSPEISGRPVRVVNDVGALVVLDVPGPRNERLAGHYVGLPSFSLSGSVSGQLQASNVGRSSLHFSSETTVNGTPSPPHSMALVIDRALLLPAGLHRDLPVHVSSWLGLGWYHVRSTLYYDVSSNRTATVNLSRTVVLVAWPWLALPVLIVGGILFRWWWRRRKPKRRPAHSVKKSRRDGRDAKREAERAKRTADPRGKHLVRT